jgi:AraC-like DNA-binding protein
MHCACAILSSVACPPVLYISTLSHKRHDFRKERLLNIKCASWLSLQLLLETFLILRIIKRDRSKTYNDLHIKYPSFLSDFSETSIFSADFRKVFKCKNSLNCVHKEPSCSMQTDGRRADRHDEVNIRFSQFCERAEKNAFIIKINMEKRKHL